MKLMAKPQNKKRTLRETAQPVLAKSRYKIVNDKLILNEDTTVNPNCCNDDCKFCPYK